MYNGRVVPAELTTDAEYNKTMNQIYAIQLYLSLFKSENQKRTSASIWFDEVLNNFDKKINGTLQE